MAKIKSYNFWIKLISLIILVIRIILTQFGFSVDTTVIVDIVTLVAGILILLGIIKEPTGLKNENKESISMNNEKIKEDILNELNNCMSNESVSGNVLFALNKVKSLILSEEVAEEGKESEGENLITVNEVNAVEGEVATSAENVVDGADLLNEQNTQALEFNNNDTIGEFGNNLTEQASEGEQVEKVNEEFNGEQPLEAVVDAQENELTKSFDEQINEKIEEINNVNDVVINEDKLAGDLGEAEKCLDQELVETISESADSEKEILKNKIKEFINNNLDELIATF